MHALTAEWVHKADQDFEAAHRMMRPGDEPLPDVACFHCQQCAEKYLKAFLHEHKVRFKSVHPLVDHLRLCLEVDGTFETIRLELESLDLYAVRVRYPGLSVTPEMALAALTAATRVRDFVRLRLGLHQPPT